MLQSISKNLTSISKSYSYLTPAERGEGLGDLFSKEKGMNQEASPSKRSRKAKNSGRGSSSL